MTFAPLVLIVVLSVAAYVSFRFAQGSRTASHEAAVTKEAEKFTIIDVTPQ